MKNPPTNPEAPVFGVVKVLRITPSNVNTEDFIVESQEVLTRNGTTISFIVSSNQAMALEPDKTFLKIRANILSISEGDSDKNTDSIVKVKILNMIETSSPKRIMTEGRF